MKKTIAACITAALAANYSVTASAEDAYIAPLVEQSVLLDIDADKFVVVVGERGHILISEDGTAFNQVAVPTQATLTATTVVGDNIWAVGHDATIIHSSDKGQSWEIQNVQPELQRPFLDVLFFDESHGIAAGAYGLFYRTTDGGKSWETERHASLLDPYDREYLESVREEDEAFYQQELESILPHLNRVTRDGEKLYLAGEAGLLASSDDMGKSWERFEVDYTGSFFDIRALDESTLLAVGLRGNIFVLRDQGEWEYVNSCSTSTLNSILLSDNDTVVAMGNNGMMVSATRPLPVSDHDPYANPANCKPAKGITVTQVEDKAAMLNAVSFNGHTIAVTANGIKTLNTK
ncbi:WD40/YVTN/BNR-like repeat-containing protein [Alteromonas stellipolaris]|uniref:WD40/YVTN/BNR-like repeat-containing protein n=1 Tax=Alteromonas stellipolaris TaxID=233316 RepID=UPI00273233DD|nr:YCF48-related protein [Alteromonas stellipolaris]MDP2534877.1 YCF48-related protein [Alteromonas stellipolaris]